jgi:hypothetical protein
VSASLKTIFFIAFGLLASNSFSQTFTSSNLPVIVINTNGATIVNEPKVGADMGIIYNGVGVRNNVTDPFNNYNGKIGIELRGSTSQALFPKKQYGIELRDVAGEGIDASLLGLPKKDDWVLFAPYNDKSLMRDVLAYKLGRDLGRYASRYRYCELVLNGQYQGIYVLLEKVKRDKNRVNIDKLDPVEITGDNLTGGYIVKLDKVEGSGGDGWTSGYPPLGRFGSQTIYFQYEYPKQEDIASQQKQYIRDYFLAFETALAGAGFKNPDTGYAKYIDVDSFVDYFIANEISRNPDAYRLSTFIHKKKDSEGGKLSMGPIWDFNLGFGNVDFCIKGAPEGFVIDYNSICREDFWLIPFWWSRLFRDEAFKNKVTNRWTSLRAGVYQTSRIMTFIDSVATELNKESQQRNFQRWPVLGQYVWPNSFVGQSFQQEVDWLKDWVNKRLAWLDVNIPNVVTGLEASEAKQGFSWRVYPNPSVGEVKVQFETEEAGMMVVQLYDAAGGRIELSERVVSEPGEYKLNLASSTLAPGLYLVQVHFGGRQWIEKVIVR